MCLYHTRHSFSHSLTIMPEPGINQGKVKRLLQPPGLFYERPLYAPLKARCAQRIRPTCTQASLSTANLLHLLFLEAWPNVSNPLSLKHLGCTLPKVLPIFLSGERVNCRFNDPACTCRLDDPHLGKHASYRSAVKKAECHLLSPHSLHKLHTRSARAECFLSLIAGHGTHQRKALQHDKGYRKAYL